MTTYAAEPKLTSTEERSYHILKTAPGIVTRVMDLSGIPIRICIDPKYKKVSYRSNGDRKDLKEFLKEKYLPLFKDLMKSFLNSEAYIYGVLREDKFLVYDFLVNTNWFTYDDLIRIRDEYNYGESGFELLEPIAQGNFTQMEYLKIFQDILEKDPKKNGKIHIMPYFDIIKSSDYQFKGKVGYYGFGTPDTIDENLCYEYTAPATSAYYNNYGRNYNYGGYYAGREDYYDDDYASYYGEGGRYSTYPKGKGKEEKKNRSARGKNEDDLLAWVGDFEELESLDPDLVTQPILHPCNILTKPERKIEYEKAFRNIVSFFKDKYGVEPNKTDLPVIKLISYLWGIWSNIAIRSEIVEFLKKEENTKFSQGILCNRTKGYAEMFYALWCRHNRNNIRRLSKQVDKNFNPEFIEKVLTEEFMYFDAAFKPVMLAA